jgi:hypothetical protein
MKVAIQELAWEILPHSPYSLDLAPSDYLPLPLSPTICVEFPSTTTTLSSKIGLKTSLWQTSGFLQAWDRELA